MVAEQKTLCGTLNSEPVCIYPMYKWTVILMALFEEKSLTCNRNNMLDLLYKFSILHNQIVHIVVSDYLKNTFQQRGQNKSIFFK